jgi:hypothetical protein
MKCLFCSSDFDENRLCTINTVCETCCNDGDRQCPVDCKNEQIGVLQKRIAELEEKLRWIPVSERLPENASWIMVRQGVTIGMCMFHNGEFYDPTYAPCFNIDTSKITNWREIPELDGGL